MKCSQDIYCKDWYRVSNRIIFKAISVDHPVKIIKKSTLKFVHKLIWTKTPTQHYEKLKFNSKHRECSTISVKDPVRKSTNKRTPIYTGLDIFNTIPVGLKLTKPSKFKEILKKMKL